MIHYINFVVEFYNLYLSNDTIAYHCIHKVITKCHYTETGKVSTEEATIHSFRIMLTSRNVKSLWICRVC